jgi:hypothetical protein
VSIFLQETGSRHSILTKYKSFGDQKKISSNSNKLIGESGSPIVIGDNNNGEPGVQILVESDEEPEAALQDIPETASADGKSGRSKRRRTRGAGDDGEPKSSNSAPASKRKKTVDPPEPLGQDDGDEKKLGLATTYEGFGILGWMLCLLVTRKSERTRNAPEDSGGQVLMEEWISTQAQRNDYEDE